MVGHMHRGEESYALFVVFSYRGERSTLGMATIGDMLPIVFEIAVQQETKVSWSSIRHR